MLLFACPFLLVRKDLWLVGEGGLGITTSSAKENT